MLSEIVQKVVLLRIAPIIPYLWPLPGYGNYSPKTDEGKIFCILYGLVGIPICGIFLAFNTNYFSNIFLHLYEKQKARRKDKQSSIIVAAFVFLLPGLAAFLFVPSAIFMVLEVWLLIQRNKKRGGKITENFFML